MRIGAWSWAWAAAQEHPAAEGGIGRQPAAISRDEIDFE